MTNTKHPHFAISLLGIRITSILSISLVLFLVGLLTSVFLAANRLNNFVKENITFSIVLKNGVGDKQVELFMKCMQNKPYVKSCTYVSKEQAMKLLVEELGENPEEFLGFNPLQASLEVKLNSQYANKEAIATIEKEIRGEKNTQDVLYRKEMLELVNENLGRVGMILSILSVVLCLVSIILVNNTIRLHIYSKRFLIHTMQLVGATPQFIYRPFVKSNIVNGLVASVVALLMLSGLLGWIFSGLNMLSNSFSKGDVLVVVGMVVGFGVFITWFSARRAVGRYLKMKVEKLYTE